MTLTFMVMSSMTMMTLNLYSGYIVIVGSPDGKSGTPTFVKSVVFSRFDNMIKNCKLKIKYSCYNNFIVIIVIKTCAYKEILKKENEICRIQF